MKKILITGFPTEAKLNFILDLKQELEKTGPVIRFGNEDVRDNCRFYAFDRNGRLPQGTGIFKEPDGKLYDYALYDICDPKPEEKDVIIPDYVVWFDFVTGDLTLDLLTKYESPVAYDFRITEDDAPKWVANVTAFVK